MNTPEACVISPMVSFLATAGPFVVAIVIGLIAFIFLGKMHKSGKMNLGKNTAVVVSFVLVVASLAAGFAFTKNQNMLFEKECEDFPAADHAQPEAMSGQTQDSRRWFEWEFKFEGKDYRIQLMDLPEEQEKNEAEADAPEVQMVLEEKREAGWETIKVQNSFLDLETYGEAPPAKTPEMIEIGDKRIAVLYAMTDLAQGVSSEIHGIFEVTPDSMGYRGHLFVSSNNKENCVAKSKESDEQCFSWTSKTETDKSQVSEGLYTIKVLRQGTFYNADTDKVENVGILNYKFNGDQYSSFTK